MKPILFNTEMVQAILEGRKTVTRRVIKPQPKCYGPNLAYKHEANLTDVFLSAEKGILRCRRCGHYPEYSSEGSNISHQWKPHYKIGDILYVRETWSEIDDLPYDNYVYRADYGTTEDDSFPPSMFKWHPSIHMPKEAARIFLKVTGVRVERLQDITEEQAKAEGIKLLSHDGVSIYTKDYKTAFEITWDSIYKNSKENPWVWVIEFERVEVENE